MTMTLNEMRDSYDWQEAIVYTNNARALPGVEVEQHSFTFEDVRIVLASDEGENDYSPWIAIFLLKDGRLAYLAAGCDYTGWDCQAYGSVWFAETWTQMIQLGIDDGARERLDLEAAAVLYDATLEQA